MNPTAKKRTLTCLTGMLLISAVSVTVYFSRTLPLGTVVRVTDGTKLSLGKSFPPNSAVFFCLLADCPIGNRYVPKIGKLADEFRPLGYTFHLVYPDDAPAVIKRHQEEFGLGITAYHDPDHAIVRLLGITRAPEAVVFDSSGRQIYRGRIDDQFVDFGTSRQSATTDDLRDVLTALSRGETVSPRVTKAVGCYIE